ncbi:MAG: riboflavin synthase [Actinomycetales bacterium]|nr:riboflavin synthase [Actinomycetales bacterium]
MFTGIVEEMGEILAVELLDGGTDSRVHVRGPRAASDAQLGDSIAVSGVCLTVTSLPGDGTFTADVMPETLRYTTLGGLEPGSRVNLERSLRADARLGGHIVQGHVDGVGTVRERTPGPRWDEIVIELPRELAPLVARKGAITVDGVSLTVTDVGEDWFGISLIPTTLEVTTLGATAPGTRVNLEADVLAKYTQRLLATQPTTAQNSTGEDAK